MKLLIDVCIIDLDSHIVLGFGVNLSIEDLQYLDKNFYKAKANNRLYNCSYAYSYILVICNS